MFHILRVLVLLFALDATFAVDEVAVVCPFATVEDFALLLDTIDSWNAFLPCETNTTTPLVLAYSGSKDNAGEKLNNAITRFIDDFNAGTDDWQACFSSCTIQYNDISPDKDVYNDISGAVGPNLQFVAIADAFRVSAYVETNSWFLMEADTAPQKNYWLDRMIELSIASHPYGVLGSKYMGDKWFPFYNEIEPSLKHHINGNALYTSSEVLFNAIVGEIKTRTEAAFTDGIKVVSYDYMFRQIFEEASSPECSGSICSAYATSQEEGMGIFMNTLQDIVSNYAKTNMLQSNFGDEYLQHGAVKVQAKQDLALVVSMFSGEEAGVQEIISVVGQGNTPFTEIVVVSPDGTEDFPGAKNVHIPLSANRFNDLCLPLGVTKSHFLHVNSEFTIMPNSIVFENADGQVFMSGIQQDNMDCSGTKTCEFLSYRAQTMVEDLALKGEISIWSTEDTIYHTATVAKFCPAFDAWFSDYRYCDHCSFETEQCVLGGNVFSLIEDTCSDEDGTVCTCNQLIWSENFALDGFDPHPGPSSQDYLAFCFADEPCRNQFQMQNRSVYGKRSVALRTTVPPYDKYSEWFFGSEQSYLENTTPAGCEKLDSTACSEDSQCEYQDNFSICTMPLGIVEQVSKAPTFPDQPPPAPTQMPTPAPTKPNFAFDDYCGWSTTGTIPAMLDNFDSSPATTAVTLTVPAINSDWSGDIDYSYTVNGGAQQATAAGNTIEEVFTQGKQSITVGASAKDGDGVIVISASCFVEVDVVPSDVTDVAEVIVDGSTFAITNGEYNYTIPVNALSVDVQPILRFGQSATPISDSATFRATDDVDLTFSFTITAQNKVDTAVITINANRIVPQEDPEWKIACSAFSTETKPESGDGLTYSSSSDLYLPSATDPNTGFDVSVDGPFERAFDDSLAPILFPYKCSSGSTCEFFWTATKTHNGKDYTSQCSYTAKILERTNSACQSLFTYTLDGSTELSAPLGQTVTLAVDDVTAGQITVQVNPVDADGSGESFVWSTPLGFFEREMSCGAQDPNAPVSTYKVSFNVPIPLELDTLSSPDAAGALSQAYDNDKTKAFYDVPKLQADSFTLNFQAASGISVEWSYTDSNGVRQTLPSGGSAVYGSFGTYRNVLTLTDDSDPSRTQTFSVNVEVPAPSGATLALYSIIDQAAWDDQCQNLGTSLVTCQPWLPGQATLKGQETDVNDFRSNNDLSAFANLIAQFVEPDNNPGRRRRLQSASWKFSLTIPVAGNFLFDVDSQASVNVPKFSASLNSASLEWKLDQDDNNEVSSILISTPSWDQTSASDLLSSSTRDLDLDFGATQIKIFITYTKPGSTFPTKVQFNVNLERPAPAVAMDVPVLRGKQGDLLAFSVTMEVALTFDVDVMLQCTNLLCPTGNKVTIPAGDTDVSGTVSAAKANSDTSESFAISSLSVPTNSSPEPYFLVNSFSLFFRDYQPPPLCVGVNRLCASWRSSEYHRHACRGRGRTHRHVHDRPTGRR
jgi:hypothetical protein